jgi:Na+/H+ antiporter NhaC
MDTTTGIVAYVVRSVRRLGVIGIPALIIVVAALAGVVIGDLLAPASEPVIVAPFRW